MFSATWYVWSTTSRWLVTIFPMWKFTIPGIDARYFLAAMVTSLGASGLLGSVQKITTCENIPRYTMKSGGEKESESSSSSIPSEELKRFSYYQIDKELNYSKVLRWLLSASRIFGTNERTNLHQLPARGKPVVSQKPVRPPNSAFRSEPNIHGCRQHRSRRGFC